jgi:O-antigen ligase
VLNPNSIAMVGMSVILCAMAIRDLKVRIVVLFASITVMILTGSRTSTIATIFGLFVTSWYRIRFRSVIGKIIIVSVFFVVLIGVTLTINEVREAVSGFFALGDRKRGLGSGATGRFNAWQLTWELFMNYPLTGVGFRAHEKYFSGMEGASAHNGYLATLAEIGLIGFICNILLIFSGFLKLWRFARDPLLAYSHSILLGLGCGYLLLAMFERYLINIGNPTSLLFLLCVTIPPDSMVGSDGAMASTIVQSTEKDKKTNRSP